MKYNYHVPAYTRISQYTPSTYHTPTYYSLSHYTPTQYTSTYSSASKYGAATQLSTTHYSPSKYTSTYRAASTYIPSYSKGSRYSSTQRTQTRENPAPVIPVAPAKRSVHFPNDIVFQDIVRRGDMEQIGRFMRAKKVRIDTLFHSGETDLYATNNMEKKSRSKTFKLRLNMPDDRKGNDGNRWLMMLSSVQAWQPFMKLC